MAIPGMNDAGIIHTKTDGQ